jgi:hypothetical protein
VHLWPPQPSGVSACDATCGPPTGQPIDVRRGERLSVRRGLKLNGNRQAVTRAFAHRARRVPASRECRQIRGALSRERTVAMTSQDGGIVEQRLKHDGILLGGDSITAILCGQFAT